MRLKMIMLAASAWMLRPYFGRRGICVDPLDVNTIYISSNAQNPFALTDTTNVTLRANSRYEIWRGKTTDGGLTFSWTQITTNSTLDNIRPYIPRRNGGENCVLWLRGTYTSYTSYAMSIVGLFTSAVPTNSTTSSTQLKIRPSTLLPLPSLVR